MLDIPNRTELLSARCRPREKEVVVRAAQARGVRLSELIREATLREARRELESESGQDRG